MSLPFNISIQVVVFVSTFILSLIAGPVLIPALTRLKFGQTVRDDGPASHFVKTGTPTIGGLIFLIPMAVVSLYFYFSGYTKLLPLILTTTAFGLIGFLDDFIKVLKKRKDGLYPRQKMLSLLFVAAAFAFYVQQYTDIGTDIYIPFLGTNATLDLSWFFIPFTILFFASITNAVNLTDGLDGLCSGVTLIIAVFFTLVAMTRNEWDYIKIFSSITAGGCLGFLAFNIHPAKVFMGDTGSLALGGAIGAIAVMMKMPLFIIIVGAVYFVEALSVIIQVGSYKLRRKRVFKMAPLHHHFELSGWKETKVVTVFWLATVLFCIIGFIALRFRIY